MSNGEVRVFLRKLYNELFGPGYFDAHTEAVYLYTWQFDKENGPASVYIDIMAHHGGDQALAARPGFGTWR